MTKVLESLSYTYENVIGNGFCWGKYMLIFRKANVKSKQVAAQIYIIEDSIVLKMFFNNVTKHSAYISNTPNRIKHVFTGSYGTCKHCKGDNCKFRKEYEIDSIKFEKCNGTAFEFYNLKIESYYLRRISNRKETLKLKKTVGLFIIISMCFQLFFPVTSVYAATPLSTYGSLSVKGTKLVNKKGNTVQLKGVSTHGISWFPQYLNKKAMKTMKEQWGINVIRIAMYTYEWNGYCNSGKQNQKSLQTLVCQGIEHATDLGLYVIIDWHILNDGNPNTHLSDAKSFFHTISKKYKKNKNILYEICNEPNGGTTWNDIKKYAKKVIPVIRKNDRDAIIIVGTPNWCQDVDIAAKSPLTGYKNILYSLHFYADTHRDSYRKKALSAVKSGLPLFVSEFSISNASGNGAINTSEGNKWIKLLNQYKISYTIWNLSNKNESSALIKNTCNKTSGWNKADLTATGKWFLTVLKK